jgi:hypothetical protein
MAEARRTGHPYPDRDVPRRHQGDGRGRGNPDRTRRHDLTRGARGTADGEGLRGRLRSLEIDYATHTMTVKGKTIREGDWISLDGTTGEVIEGKVATRPSEVLQRACRQVARPEGRPRVQQYATHHAVGRQVPPVEDPHERRPARPGELNAVAFGAEGIGLCRTEHMFFG